MLSDTDFRIAMKEVTWGVSSDNTNVLRCPSGVMLRPISSVMIDLFIKIDAI
jgi:hypothetical protein